MDTELTQMVSDIRFTLIVFFIVHCVGLLVIAYLLRYIAYLKGEL